MRQAAVWLQSLNIQHYHGLCTRICIAFQRRCALQSLDISYPRRHLPRLPPKPLRRTLPSPHKGRPHFGLHHGSPLLLHISSPSCLLCSLFRPFGIRNRCLPGPFRVLRAGVDCLESLLLEYCTGPHMYVVIPDSSLLGLRSPVDAVLLQLGKQNLVERGRQVRSSSSGFKVLGRSLTKPLSGFSKEGIVRYVLSLPLNSIPGVGTAFFLVYNGTQVLIVAVEVRSIHCAGVKAGPSFHARYFQLKNYDKTTRDSFVESRRGAYTA